MLSIAIVVDEIRFDQKRNARAPFVLFGKMGNVSITIALYYIFRCHCHLDINGDSQQHFFVLFSRISNNFNKCSVLEGNGQ